MAQPTYRGDQANKLLFSHHRMVADLVRLLPPGRPGRRPVPARDAANFLGFLQLGCIGTLLKRI